MLFDVLALGMLAIFVALGAWRGTIAGFLRVATLFTAYAAGIFAAAKFATLISILTGNSRLLSGAMAGAGMFLLVYVALSLISALLIHREKAARDDEPRSGLDRAGGAFFGAGQAVLALLLLGVLGSFLDAAHAAGLPQGSASAGSSYLVGSTRRLVSAGVSAAMGGGRGGTVAAKLASDPGAAVVSTQKLLADPRISILQQDALFWQYLSAGEPDLALSRPSFIAIVHDDELRAQLADLGIVSDAARTSPEAFRSELQATLTEVAPRVAAIRNDPALAELAAQPDVQEALRNGDSFAILSNPEFRRLVDRVLRDYENRPSAPASGSGENGKSGHEGGQPQ